MLYGIPLGEAKRRLREGAFLDDVIGHLGEGDLVCVYNPYGDDEEAHPYVGAMGHVVDSRPERDAYLVDTIDPKYIELGQKWFARAELELLSEEYNPRYAEEMGSMPWWPDVARERAEALSSRRRMYAENEERMSSSEREAMERYHAENEALAEEARLRRDEYLDEARS